MPSATEPGTLSSTGEPNAARDADRCPHLFLVLEGQRPLAQPIRIALEEFDDVLVGRGRERRLAPARDRRIVLHVNDSRMSTSHARFTKVLRRWIVEDIGSKNGTSVNGLSQTHAELSDGDLIELGHTFFVFREALSRGPDDAAIFESRSVEPAVPGLATVLPPLAQALRQFTAMAHSAVPVLLEGETGTGKEVLSRALHALSGRTGDFVAVNCGALPKDLVEGELFGHRRGAFSGAVEDRPGLVRSADKGTLFLDEIGDLPAAAQATLLRVLQENEVRPLGATRAIPVDLRVVSATHRSLEQMVLAGDFRQDLLQRIVGYRFELPPLRFRREDLGLLLGTLLRRLPVEEAAKVTLHPRAGRALLLYRWPGNVRELEKCLNSALVLARSGVIEVEHLPGSVRGALETHDSIEATRRAELVALLREHRGNVTAVATQMRKARMQIQRWMKHYDIDIKSFRR